MATVTDVRKEGGLKLPSDSPDERKITWPNGEPEDVRRAAEKARK